MISMTIAIILILSLALAASCVLNLQMYRSRSQSYISVTKHDSLIGGLKKERDSFVRQITALNEQMASLYENTAQKAEALAMIRFDAWKAREEKNIREDTLKRSVNVNKGKVSEHLVPFYDKFPFNGKDCRFVGTPIDYIIFDGLDNNELKEIVFLEIKTGEHAKLNHRERLVRDAIEAGKVKWQVLSI